MVRRYPFAPKIDMPQLALPSIRNLQRWLPLLCLALVARPIHADELRKWPYEMTSGRFQIHSDFKLQAESDLLKELEFLSREMEFLLQIPVRSEPIHIVLFEKDSEYRRYMKAYFPTLPDRRALFIQDRGPGMLFTHWHADVATDLRHEVSHALVNHSGRPLPLWLDEGLAEYFEIDVGRRLRGNPYHSAIVDAAKRGRVRTLSELASTTQLSNFTDLHYRDSWAWIHFLIHRRSETRQILIRYLQEHAAGSEPFDLEKALVAQLPQLQTEFEQHFVSLRSESTVAQLPTPSRSAQ